MPPAARQPGRRRAAAGAWHRAWMLVLLALLAAPAWAVEPSEMLDDPALEARAQALDGQIRCVKCRSESIATSKADWASDARVRVRELVAAGRTDAEVKAFFVERYGDFVLMRPRAGGINVVLWAAAPVMLLVALALAWLYIRGRRGAGEAESLSAAERDRLAELLRE